MANKFNKGKIIRGPLNSKNNWFKNVIKSMGYTSLDIIKDVAPATSEFIEDSGNASMNIINSMRGKVTEEKFMDRSLDQISPLVKMSSQGLKNALEDIKTGNFYNKEREQQYLDDVSSEFEDDMFGGFDDEDFDFGDDFDEGDMFVEDTEVEEKPKPAIQSVRVVNDVSKPSDFLPAAEMIAASGSQNTMATVKSIQGLGRQQKAFQIQSFLRDEEFNTTLFSSLASMGDNLSTILKIKTDNESKFISLGTDFFGSQLEKMDEIIKNTKGDDRTPEEIKDDNRAKNIEQKPDIFLTGGGLDVENYFKNIKSNIMDIDEISMMFDQANDIFSDQDMMNKLIEAPLRSVMKGAMKSLIPKIAQDSIKLFDDTLSTIFPAMIAKINKMSDADLEDDSMFGVIKSFIGKIFGYDIEKKTSANLGKFERGPVPFDGITRKTITDIIPTYLRRIESAITGTGEKLYDFETGKFISIDEAEKFYNETIQSKELSGYRDIINLISKSLNELNIDREDRQSFETDLIEYFKTMNTEGKSINPFTYINKEGEEIDELDDYGLFFDEDNKKLFRRILSELNNVDLMKMMGSNIFDSIKEKNEFFKMIEEDPTLYNYKYLNDNSIIQSDYEYNIETNKKTRKKVFDNFKDKYGNTNLDYLRDIKSILLNGVRVFVSNIENQSPTPGFGPRIIPAAINNNFRDEMAEEERRYNELQRNRNIIYENLNESRRSIFDINNMNDRDFTRSIFGDGESSEVRDYINNLIGIPKNNPFSRLKNKLSQGVIKVTEGPAEKFNDMVYKLIFGSEEVNVNTLESGDLFERTKTKLSAFHTWTITSVYEPVKEALIGKEGIITKIGQSKIFRKLTDKKNDIIDYLFGLKNNQGVREGGFLSGLYNKSKDLLKSIGHYFTGKEYTDSDGNKIVEDDNALFRRAKRTIKEKFNQGKEKLSDIPKDFMEGYHRFRESLFGKASEAGFKKQTMKEFADDIKSKLPKAVGTGLLTGAAKAVLFSKAGLLGSLFLPGGVIGAVLTGTTASFLMQSEKFKNWLFGEKDPEDPNKRLGGFIPKSLQDLYSENKTQIKIGGAIGAGVGLLPSFFLPGGPLTGAILGVTTGLVTKSDAFQEFLYGENFKDGDKKLMNGAFGKAFAKGKEVFDKYGVDPKQATFLGGVGALAGGFGLIPAFFLPGGPIGGALLGMAGGIVASSNKFQEFLLGEKQWDGKRHGGLITKFSTWFDIHVVDSLKITMKEWNMKVSDFLYDSIAEPFLKATGPVGRAMEDAAEKVKDIFKAGWDKINENVVGVFKDNVIKPFGESLEKYIVNPLKKFLNKSFSLAGKILGAVVSAPFKLIGAIGNRLDKKNEKNAVKGEKERRRSEAYENIKNDIKSGNFSFKDLRANIRSAKLSKEEREELIKEATSYRDKYEKGKEARDAKRAARRDKLQSEINEMKDKQKRDSEFFKRNGKFRNKEAEEKWKQQQREKQVWYQQHIAESGMETVEKLDEINKAMKDLQDSPRILSSMEEGLLNELRDLKKVMEEQLAYFKQEGFVDTSYLRRKREQKPEPVQPNIHFNMNNITNKPEVSPMFKNANNISRDAQKKQDPRINNIIDILRRNGQSHAEGLDMVPYDGYVAELHKGERVVPGDERQDINVKGEKEKFKMLNSIKRHTRMIADEVKGQLYGVGTNLHHIRKILQHMSGLKDDEVNNIKDQNIPDGGGIGKFFHNMKVKIGSPIDRIKEAVEKPFNWISEKLTSIKDGFVSVFNSIKEIPGKIVDHVGTAINTILGGVVDGLSIAFKGAAQITVKAANLALTGVSTVVSDLYKGSRFLVTTIAKSFVPVLKGAGKAVGMFAEGIAKAGKLAIDAVFSLGKGVYTVTKDMISMGYTIIKDVIKGGLGVVKGIGGAAKAVFGGGLKFAGNIFGAAKSKITGKETKGPQEVKVVGGYIDEISKVTSIEELNIINKDNIDIDEKIRSNIGKMKLGDTLEQTSNVVREETKQKISNEVIVLNGKLDTIDQISKLDSIENIVKVRVINPDDMKQQVPTGGPVGPRISAVRKDDSPVVNIGNMDSLKDAVIGDKKAKDDVKEQYKDQIKEQMKAEKEKEKEQEAKADRAHVSRLSADYVQEQKRIKKEQLLETQYKEETMKDIDSTDKTLTKQYDFWYDLFGKNGKIHTKLKNLWEWAKKLFPMLLSWFKGTGLFNTLTKVLGGTGLKTFLGSALTALAPTLVGLVADQLDKKEREERADEYNLSDYDAYVGQGKESRWDGEEYVLNGDRVSAKYNLLGQQGVKIAKSDLVQQGVQVGKNIYKNTKPYAQKAASKVSETGSKVMEKGGNLFNSIKSKLGFGSKAVTETGMSTVEFATSEILDDTGKVIAEGKYRVIDVADDVAKNNDKLFAKLLTKGKEALVKLFEYVGTKLGNTKLGAKALQLIAPIFTKLKGAATKIMAKYAPKITTFFGEKVAGMLSLGVIEAGFAIWNAGTGLTKGDTANLFGVKTDQVDWKMRTISAALKTVTNFSWIGVIYLLNEILADIFDINLLRWVAGIIYKFVASVKDSEELKENQDQMKEEWQQYNAENGTNMSFEAYMDKQSPTTADKIVNNNWFKNFRATFDKGSAANALGKNKEDVNLWDRIKFGAGHTVNNIMNLFRKDKKSDSEFFLGKEQVVDEKGNAVLDKDGKPQYKAATKETKKKTKETDQDKYAGMGDGPASEAEAIQNGFKQESVSTSNWLDMKTKEHKTLIGSIAAGFNTAKATIMGWYTSQDDDIAKTLKKKKSKVNILDRKLWGQLKAFNWAANLFRDDTKKLSTKEEAETIMKHFKDIGDSMSNWLKKKTEHIKELISSVGRGFSSVISKFNVWWTGNDENIANTTGKDPKDINNWDRIKDKVATAGRGIANAAKGTWNWLTGIFKKTPNTSSDTSTINSGFNSINNGGTVIDTTNSTLDGSEGNTTEETPAYAQGTPWIPETQVALVHEGEMVIPAEKNPMNPANFVPYSKMVTDVMSNNNGISTEALTNTKTQVSPEVAVTAVADVNKEEVKDEVKKQNSAIAKNPTIDTLGVTGKTITPTVLNIQMAKDANLNIYGLDKLFEKLQKEYEESSDNVSETTVTNKDKNKTTTTTVTTDKNGKTETTVKTSSKDIRETKNPNVAVVDEDKLNEAPTADTTSKSNEYFRPAETDVSDTNLYTPGITPSTDTSYYSPSTGAITTDSTSTDAYVDTSSEVYSAEDSTTFEPTTYIPKKLTKYEKAKQMLDRKLPRNKDGDIIKGDPLEQGGYYTSYYLTKDKDPVTQNAIVTSEALKKEAKRKAEEEKRRSDKVNSTGNSAGAKIQRDINTLKGFFGNVMNNPTVKKGVELFSSINANLGGGRDITNNGLAKQKTDKKDSRLAGKGDDTTASTTTKNASTITNPLAGVFSFLGSINKGMKTGTGREGQYTSSKSVEKSAQEAKKESIKLFNLSKDSISKMIKSEDDQVKRMYNITDKDKSPTMGQRFWYKMSKPITDMVNDIRGKNELSYGAGGNIVRDRVEGFNKDLSKSEKDKTGTIKTDNKGLFNFVQNVQDKIGKTVSDINKGLGRSDKDKTGGIKTDNKGLFNFVKGVQDKIGKTASDINKGLKRSDKDKTGGISTDNKGLVGFFNKIGDTFNNINKNLGKSEKDKTGSIKGDNKGLIGTVQKIGKLATDINNGLKRSDKDRTKAGKTDTSWLNKAYTNTKNTLSQMNKALKGSDRLTEGSVESENTKIKNTIQKIGNNISKGVGTTTKVFKQFSEGLNKSSKDVEKTFLKDETNPFKTAVQKMGKKMSDGIKGMGDAYNKFKDGIVNKIKGTADKLTKEGQKGDKSYEKETGTKVKTPSKYQRTNSRTYDNNQNRKTVTTNPKKKNTTTNKKTTKKSTPKKQSLWSKITGGVKKLFGFGGSDTKPLNQQVKPKNYVFSELDYEYLGDNKGQSLAGLKDIGNTHNYAYYSQLDERWSENKMGRNNTLGIAGCGPTSAAMILTQMTGQRITPDTMAQIGTKYLNDYTTTGYFPEIATEFKLNYEELNSQDISKLKTALKNKQGVVLGGFNKASSMMTPFTKEGHIVVATGIKGDKVQINDPRGPGYSGEYSLNDVMRALNKGYVLELTEETMKLDLPSSGKFGKEKPKPKAKYRPKDIVEKAKQKKAEIEEKLKQSKAVQAAKKIVDKVKDTASTVKDKITDSVKNVADKTKNKVLELKDKLVNSKVGQTVKKVIDKVKNNKVVKKVTNTVKKGVDKVKEGANWVLDKGKQILGLGGKETLHLRKQIRAREHMMNEDVAGFGGSNTIPLRSQVKAKNYAFEDDEYEYTGDNKGKRVGGLRDVGNTHNFAYYSQLDERWSGNKSIGGSTIGEAGCGPTSAAMVLTQITGQRITPDTMAQIGGEYLPGYSSYRYFPEIATKFKLNYSEIQPGEEYALKDALQSNKPVILSGFNYSDSITSPYTSQGHIIVATGMKGNRVQINDPRGPGYSGEYTLNDIMRGMKRGFIFTGTQDTLKTGLPSSGKYSNVSLMDKYQMNEDLPDDESMDESLGSAGQIRLWEKVVGYARAFLGKLKYSYGSGAIDNNGMTTDCSHFTAHVINRAAEMNIPPGSSAQRSLGKHVTKAQAGDLVLWPGHAGLVVDSNGNMIDAGSGTVANFKSYTKSYWGKRSGRTFRRVLDDPNKLVDPKVKNYHTRIGFNGIVNPQGGGVLEGGSSANGIENFLFIGDSMMKCMEPTVKKDTPSVKVVHAGGKEASYFLKRMDTLPKDGVEGVVSWIGVNGVMNSNNSNTKNTTELLSKLASKYSGKKVYAMKVFPVGQKWSYNGVTADKMNPGIQELNSALQSYTSSNGMGFIDATSGFVDDKGYLKGSKDNLHIYGEADNKKILGVIKSAVGADQSSSSSTAGDASVSSGGSAPAIPELGVFEKLSQGFTNVVASMYNGKQVDLFASSGSTDTSTDTSNSDETNPGGQTPTGTGNFPKYQLNDAQIKGLANILDHEQPGTAGIYAEASIMANLNDIKGDHMATTENLLKRAVYGGSWGGTHLKRGWFASCISRFENPGNPSKTAIQAIKDVIIGGKRTLPRYVDEHDCFSDITSVTNNGAAFNKTNRSAYKPHVTKFHNRWGASGTFYSFPGPGTDPFFYTSDSYRKKWGENCYSVGGAGKGEVEDDEFLIFPDVVDDEMAGKGPDENKALTTEELIAEYGESAGADGENTGSKTPGGFPYTLNNYAYFCQKDKTWSPNKIGGTTVSTAGCGPSSLAIIATQLTGKIITPYTIAKAGHAAGHWGPGGAQWSLFDWFGKKFGMKWNIVPKNDLATARKELKAGHPIVVSGKTVRKGAHTPYTAGHIVPFIGMESSGKIIVNDPQSLSHAHAYEDSGLAQGNTNILRQGWAYIPPATVPSDIQTSGDYNASTGAVTNVVTNADGTTGDGTTGDGTSTESAAPAIPELGVFEKLSQGFTNVIASMYNGKQVDLFASSGSTDTSTDTNTSTSDGTNPDISGQDTSDVNGRKKAIWTFLTGKGFSPESAAGVMGNIHTESGGTYSPSTIQGNGRGPAAGICQWENYNTKSKRWKELSDYAASKGKKWDDMQSQLEFLDMELSGRSKDTYANVLLKKKVSGGYEGFKKLKDIRQAVVIFERSFERARVQAHDLRTKYAKQNYNQFANAGTGPDAVLDFTRLTFDDNAGMGDWTYYDQTDPQWNEMRYDGNTIEESGCGPTSLAMIASDITGEQITPDIIASAAYKAGVWDTSSSWEIFPWFADKMNLDISAIKKENDLEGIINMLNRGEKVAVSGISTDRRSPFTRSGHIVNIVGRNKNGNFIINDPRGRKYSGEYKPEDIVNAKSLIRGAWGYKADSKINALSNLKSSLDMTNDQLYANAGSGEDDFFTPEVKFRNQNTTGSLPLVEVSKSVSGKVPGMLVNSKTKTSKTETPLPNLIDGLKEKIAKEAAKKIEEKTNTSKVVKGTIDIDKLKTPERVKQVLNEDSRNEIHNTKSEMNYVRACLESLNVAVNELKSINTNTRETADNVSQIKVYSANEPVSKVLPQNAKPENVESKKSNNFYKKSKTIGSPESNEYYIARKIASFNK